nr:hypothetical protein [uncultured Friedmanniella sp.]
MTGAVFESDDNVGSSHDADVDAAYDNDDDESTTDMASGTEDVVGGDNRTSHDADVEASQQD